MLAQPVSIRPREIATWLMGVAGLVFVMIVVGGITRLTESGLSITRWEPVTGAIPPLNEADWQAAFDLYRDSPQYQQVNRGMTWPTSSSSTSGNISTACWAA
jgi:cytochrome c oxidase assembly protein subunit 15